MQLLVTIFPKQKYDYEHKEWLVLSGRRLENAYGENEPEYSLDLIKERNPEYENQKIQTST